MLPVHYRVPPGAVFEGLFHHVVIGDAELGQPYAHQAHASITFFCYKES